MCTKCVPYAPTVGDRVIVSDPPSGWPLVNRTGCRGEVAELRPGWGEVYCVVGIDTLADGAFLPLPLDIVRSSDCLIPIR